MEDKDKRIPKLRRQLRVCNINMLAWSENKPNPTKEEASELRTLKYKHDDAINEYLYFIENAVNEYLHFIENETWDKHTFVSLPLDETKLKEQQEFLETHQSPIETSGN